MKNGIIILLALFLLGLCPPAVIAAGPHQDWSHPSFRDKSWHPSKDHGDRNLPFKWHDRRDRFEPSLYRMERIHDRDWNDRFPGLHSYKWHDRHNDGFRYRGRTIRDAVMFYNDADELVSVGFMHRGSFILLRDDDDGYENNDAMLLFLLISVLQGNW